MATTALGGTIVGRVSDNTGTRSLAGAQIEIPELGRSAVTQSDGSYRFADVDSGTYTLVVRYVGALSVEQEIAVSGDGVVRADIGMGPDIDEQVLVIGQRAVMASSLSRQRASDTVDTVLTRDAIGQFPDQNVAEALRRAPGINVLNDQGEGRFVAVRGMNKDLNSVSINGARVPAPEDVARYVALDVLPVELIESIEIKKTLTPDMDADTIGGSIQINTTSALDRREPYLGFSLEQSHNDLSGETTPKASVDFSKNFNDVFGIAGGVSFYNREFSTDNIEPDGWGETDGGIAFADEVQYRDYDVERERLGMSLSLDFQPTDQVLLYAKILHSEFDDQEFRSRLTFEFDEEPAAGSASQAQFLSDDGKITVERDIKDRFEAQEISSAVLGGEFFTGAWSFDLAGSVSLAEEKENGSLDPTAFEREFEDPGEFDITFDYSDRDRPVFTVDAGLNEFLDPAEYEFKDIERTTRSNAEDEEASFELNGSREFALDRGSFELQFGFKNRFREKTYDKTVEFFEDFDFTLADVLGRATYGLMPIDPVADPLAIRTLFAQNFDSFEKNVNDSQFDSAVEDYRVDEDILAYYISGLYENGPLRIIGGFRYEETENQMRGNVAEFIEEGSTFNGSVLTQDVVVVTSQRYKRDYDDWYPSINLRYSVGDDIVVRAGYYDSLVRPNMYWLAPRFEVEEEDDAREGTFGNPNLLPYKASNFDISAEWYFADNAVLSAGVFTKDIEDFIVEAEFEDVTWLGIQADEAIIPINGDEATVDGVELNYQQALMSLRGPWSGLLFGVNFTYTDTEGRVNGRTIPLPETSENVLNTMIGYENDRWSLRLAATYRDEYLDELNFTGNADEDRWVTDHTQIDISAKYNINDNFQVFLDLINLTDEPYVAFQRGPGRDRLLQYEEYSWTSKLGFRMNF
ncbi:MAG: TonB-dependent receptor [Gammaproteobacteria bacterium]|jgi:TonB-dependent receptor